MITMKPLSGRNSRNNGSILPFSLGVLMMINHYHNLLAVLAVAIFYTNVPIYLNMTVDKLSARDSAPVFWLIGFSLLSLPVVIRQLSRSNVLRSPLIIWCFGYIWLAVTSFLLSSQLSDMPWQDLRWRFLAVAELLVFLAIFTNPFAEEWARKTLVAAVLVGVGLNIYELVAPGVFSTVQGRSAGFYTNSNQAGEALVMGMLLSVTILPVWARNPFVLLAGLGIFTTLSRANIIVYFGIVGCLMYQNTIRAKEFLLIPLVTGALMVLFLMPQWDQLLTNLTRNGVINENMVERLEWFMDPFGVSDDSSMGRAQLAKDAWAKIAEHPLWGNGIGSWRETAMGTHNQYLSLMQDHGLLGGAVMPLLILAVIWNACGEVRSLALIFGSTLLFESFFTHGNLDQPFTLILYSLMAAMVLNAQGSQEFKSSG